MCYHVKCIAEEEINRNFNLAQYNTKECVNDGIFMDGMSDG